MSDLRNAVALSHQFLRQRVHSGDRVVDATCGNGHDTLFLAGLVGAAGKVLAFDVQEQALKSARLLLEQNCCLDRVHLVHAGHEQLAAHVTDPIQAVIFNLGYQPGSDKSCITRAETTLVALGQAVSLLLPGGLLVIVVYPGHEGGADEAAAVEGWTDALSPKIFSAWCSRQVNRSSAAPHVIVVEKYQ